MASAQECATRLREEARRTLGSEIAGFQQDLSSVVDSLKAQIGGLSDRLAALQQMDVPGLDPVMAELDAEMTRQAEVIRRKDQDKALVARFATEMRRKETQEEILSFLLDGAQGFTPKAALFVARGDQFLGWSCRGYSAETAATIGSCRLSQADVPALRDALASKAPVSYSDLAADAKTAELVGSSGPCHVFPLQAVGRPLAVLVAACDEGACDFESLSILMDVTGLCVENIALKIMRENSGRARTAPPQPAPEETRTATAESAPAIPPDAASAGIQAAGGNLQTGEPAQNLPVVPAPEPAPAYAPVVEPPASAPLPREVPRMTEEEKLHGEAKRFARLLVSEIKLYNEQRVLEGRENRDVYVRLKRDIDRSREMYEKRVSPAVTRKIDYFHDEIVRILGDNDPSSLGSDYPGPRVES